MTDLLPTEFTSLLRFSDWIIPTEAGRLDKRLSMSMAEAQEFYDALMGQIEPIASYLRTRSVSDVVPEDENLVHLVFSLIEVAQAVEIYGEGAVVDGADVRLFTSVIDKPLAAAAHG